MTGDSGIPAPVIQTFGGKVQEPSLIGTINCVNSTDFSVLETGDMYSCTLVIQHSPSSNTSAWNLQISDYTIGQWAASAVDVNITATNIALGSTLSVAYVEFPLGSVLSVSWNATASPLMTAIAQHTMPSSTLSITYSTSTTNGRPKVLTPVNIGPTVTGRAPAPTWTFEVRPDVLAANPEFTPTSFNASIGETIYVHVQIFPIHGYTPVSLSIFHDYQNGSYGALDLTLDSMFVTNLIVSSIYPVYHLNYDPDYIDEIGFDILTYPGFITTDLAGASYANFTIAVFVPNSVPLHSLLIALSTLFTPRFRRFLTLPTSSSRSLLPSTMVPLRPSALVAGSLSRT